MLDCDELPRPPIPAATTAAMKTTAQNQPAANATAALAPAFEPSRTIRPTIAHGVSAVRMPTHSR